MIRYVKNQGGMQSPTLNDMAMRILDWCLEHRIQLQARHIPGRLNARADLLSLQGPVQTEWMLNPSVFRGINAIWGTPELDLMATMDNSQLRLFSPQPIWLKAIVLNDSSDEFENGADQIENGPRSAIFVFFSRL